MIEVDIDGAVSYARLLSDFRYLGLVKTLFGKYLCRGIDYPLVFFLVFLPEAANFATAPVGVAFDAWPPVLE